MRNETSMSGFGQRLGRWVAPAGSGACTLSASFAAGCVGILAPLATTITALGLDWLHLWDIQMPILYGTSALALAGLASAIPRHRSFLPLGLGLLGVGAILYPLHEGMDVTIFRVLLYSGAAGLMGAAGWNALLVRRVSRGTNRREAPDDQQPLAAPGKS